MESPMSKETCINIKTNVENCPCTATDCERHGVCCQCVSAHAGRDSLPSCLTIRIQDSEPFRKNVGDLIAQAQN